MSGPQFYRRKQTPRRTPFPPMIVNAAVELLRKIAEDPLLRPSVRASARETLLRYAPERGQRRAFSSELHAHDEIARTMEMTGD